MNRQRLVFLLLLVLLPVPAGALHYLTPTLLQITPQNPGVITNARWAGHGYVLFDSDADLLGNGGAGRQIFVFSLADRVLAGSNAISQITSGSSNDHQRASANQHGTLIVYDVQLGGAGPRQVRLLDRKTGVTSALTEGAGDSMNARLDDSGRAVVFESSADFFASGVGGTQIYLVDLKKFVPGCPYPCQARGNAGLTAITAKTGTSRNAVPSYGGKTVVFESDADLLNLGQAETQIYTWRKNGPLQLLTHGPGASRNPSISRTGGLITFESTADLANSGTGGTQIFLIERNGAPRQITAAPGGNCLRPSLSSSGSDVAFVSTDDLLGLGTGGPQIYVYDLRHGSLAQITNAPATTGDPSSAAGVFFLTLLADGDLLGNGSTGTQLYLVNRLPLGNQQIP